jgi:hypothetical protein
MHFMRCRTIRRLHWFDGMHDMLTGDLRFSQRLFHVL